MRIYNLLIAIVLSFGILCVSGTVSNTIVTPASAEETSTEQTGAKNTEKDKDTASQTKKDKDKGSNLLEFLL